MAIELDRELYLRKGTGKSVENEVSDFLHYVSLDPKTSLKMINCLLNLDSNNHTMNMKKMADLVRTTSCHP